MLRFSETQLITVGERYARLISSIANHDPEWVEVPAEKYKSVKLTFEVMMMEVENMLQQLEVLHWWRLSSDVRNRVTVLEAEITSCKERLQHLQGQDSDLLKACLTVDLPPSPSEPITSLQPNRLSESALRAVSEQALKYLGSSLDLDPSIEIRIGKGTGVGVEGSQAHVRIDPNEDCIRNVLQACAQALYRNHHLRLYREEEWPEFQVVTKATPRAIVENAVGRYLAEDIVENIQQTGIESESMKMIESEAGFWEQLDWSSYNAVEQDSCDLNGIVGLSGYVGKPILGKVSKKSLFQKPVVLSSLGK